MHRLFSGGNDSSARFHLALHSLSQLCNLSKDSSEREWDSGTWPYNSEHTETVTRFFEGTEEVVCCRYERELCHGTTDDDDIYEIRIVSSKPELISLVTEIWAEPTT